VVEEDAEGGLKTMISKAIIFDLDGVLVDSKEIHFDALNLALKSINEKYVISRKEQADTFEGMTTRSKLDIQIGRASCRERV
jgi:beta-phosphoglucomutase-like phosphatase (HAD superfamily)